MTPPPSDADKPGPSGQKPGAVPPKIAESKASQPISARPDAKLEGRSPTPPVGGAKPAAPIPPQASKPGGSPTPAPTVAAPAATPGSTPNASPKPAADPVAAAKPGDVTAEPGRPGTAPAGPTTSTPVVTPSTPASPAGAPSTSQVPGGAPKVEPGKPDLAQTPKPGPTATDPAAARPTGTGPQAGTRPAGAKPTDGPIIDMKAQRIPDPPGPAGGRPEEAKDPAKGPIPTVAAASVEPETTTLAPPPPAGKARGGFGSIAAAGLIGGVVGAALLFAVGKSGMGGGNDGAGLAALDRRLSGQVASVDRRIGELAPRDALTGLDTRLAAAEATAKQALDKQALDKVGTVPAQAVAATPAEGQASGSAPAVAADLMARLDSLDQRVSALQEEPGRDQPADSKLGAVQGSASGDGAKQIAALDARVKALEGDGAKAAALARAADVTQKITSLQGEADARIKADAEAGAALGQRVDGLQQALDARTKAATEAVRAATDASRAAAEAGQVQAAEVSKAVERRLQEQSEKIAGLDKSVAERAEVSTVQAALRVVVADRVANALAAGTPYAEPLASLRRLDPGAEAKTAALAPFAETGAPTAGQLAAAFRPVADRITAKRRAVRAQSAAETGDFRAKLLSMTDGLVQVRKVDAASPEPAADPAGKVQAALDRGDLRGASAAFAALPPEAQGEAGDFGPKLKARAQAGEAARAVLAEAFEALPTRAATPPTTSAPASGR